MKQIIKEHGFHYDTNLKIWYRSDYAGIPYSDGDIVENKIADIINNATDISIMSDELRAHCIDWPSHYYLNKDRVNLLRPFTAQLKNTDVLEIGAGCGAITRFLGECNANVFALEGSKRRASIAKSRCRNLPNVEVVSENFTEFKLDFQFDVITLIGVLEYANLFTPGKNPALEMLKKVRQFLKPNGILIIAIENQIGLKYYAGAPEDHLGVRMIGVEGLYKNNGPQTFGRHTLIEMLTVAGFSSSHFTAPFPDYKLPVALITEAGFCHPDFKPLDLVTQSVKKDRQLNAPFAFSQENAWKPLFENKVALDFSNSFLITASSDTFKIDDFNKIQEANLAYYYSTNRIAKYCKETIFKNDSNSKIILKYNRLFQDLNSNSNSNSNLSLNFEPKTTSAYYSHSYTSFSQALQDVIKIPNWSYSDLATILTKYLKALEKLSNKPNFLIPFDKHKKLPGSFFDAVTHNVLFNNSNNDDVILIDEEWVANFEPTIGYLICRSTLHFFSELTIVATSNNTKFNSFLDIWQGIYTELGENFTEEDLKYFEYYEAVIQNQVSNTTIPSDGNFYNKYNFINNNALDYYEKVNPQLLIFNEKIKNLETNNQNLILNNNKLNIDINNINQENLILVEQVELLNISHKIISEELIYLRSVNEQFESLLTKSENIYTKPKKLSSLSHNYHERLLTIYNSKLWKLINYTRKLINIFIKVD